MTRRWIAVLGVIVIAALLAFPLRQAIHEAIVVPAAYVLWRLGLLYRSLSQGVWWVILVALVVLIFGRSLAPARRPQGRVLARPKPARGQVEDLAGSLNRSKDGTYFKWLIANRLGKLAYQILVQRESGKLRSVFEPLTGPDWHPSPDVQSYLESGIHRSFADFPNPRRLFASHTKTSLDLDVQEAVDFLELQIDHLHPR